MDIKKQYDVFAHDYIEGQKTFFNNKVDEARIFINDQIGDIRGKVVLDLGCGSGFFTRAFSQSAAKVIGIDNSDEQIRLAREVADGNIEYRLGDALHSALPPPTLLMRHLFSGIWRQKKL